MKLLSLLPNHIQSLESKAAPSLVSTGRQHHHKYQQEGSTIISINSKAAPSLVSTARQHRH